MYMGLWLLKYKGFEFYIANFLLLLCLDADEGSENKWNENTERINVAKKLQAKKNKMKVTLFLFLFISF